MDPNKIKAWATAIVAVLAMWAATGKVIDLRAQEAAKAEAATQVEQRMGPVEKQLETLVEQGEQRALRDRVSEDREATAWCLDREYQDLSVDARKRTCKEESVARWEVWELEDEERKTDPDP